MTLDSRRESDYPLGAKLIVRDTLYPSLSCAKLSFNQPNIGFQHFRRRAMSLATSSTGPPDLRLTTTHLPHPLPVALPVAPPASANRAGCVQCASGVG